MQRSHWAGLIIIGQYKAITAQNGFNRRIFDEFQEAQDNQFLGFLDLKWPFLRSGTPKIGSGRSNLYMGRWSRGRLTPQRAGTWDNYKDSTYVGTLDGLYQHTLVATGTRLRPVEATFLGHILGTNPAQKYIGFRPFKMVLQAILGLLKFVQNSSIKPFLKRVIIAKEPQPQPNSMQQPGPWTRSS